MDWRSGSSVPVQTVKQLLDTGKDEQRARLQGYARVVSDGAKKVSYAQLIGGKRFNKKITVNPCYGNKL